MDKGCYPNAMVGSFVLCNALKLTMDALGIHAEEGRI